MNFGEMENIIFILQWYVQNSILPMVDLKPIHLILLCTLELKSIVIKDMDQLKVLTLLYVPVVGIGNLLLLDVIVSLD